MLKESIDYKWCNINEFMDLIEWNGDKSELRNVLENAISRKVYFRETKIN